MEHSFGDNIRDAITTIRGERGKKIYKVKFPICYHPELLPTMWGQEKPEPAQTIGECPIHNYTCPICGFGVGSDPSCGCPEMR